MYGAPVERYSRGICLWQVVHKRRPTASSRREGKRLWLVVIHHFQTPVSIKRHGVTWKREQIIRNVGWKELSSVVSNLVVQSAHSYSSPLHRSLQSCCCNEIPDGGAGGSGYCSDHRRYPGGCNCGTDTRNLKGQHQHFILFPSANNLNLIHCISKIFQLKVFHLMNLKVSKLFRKST